MLSLCRKAAAAARRLVVVGGGGGGRAVVSGRFVAGGGSGVGDGGAECGQRAAAVVAPEGRIRLAAAAVDRAPPSSLEEDHAAACGG